MIIYVDGVRHAVTRVYKTVKTPVAGYKVTVNSKDVFGETVDKLKQKAEKLVLYGK